MNQEPFIFDGRSLHPAIGYTNRTDQPARVLVAYPDRHGHDGMAETVFILQGHQGLLTKTGGAPVIVCQGDRVVPRMDGTWRVESSVTVNVERDASQPISLMSLPIDRFDFDHSLTQEQIEVLRRKLVTVSVQQIERQAADRCRDFSRRFLPDDLPRGKRRR